MNQVDNPPITQYQYPFKSDFEPQPKLVNQVAGTVIAVIFALINGLIALSRALSFRFINPAAMALQSLSITSSCLYVYFFIIMVKVPEFIAGNPTIKKFWAPISSFFAGTIIILVAICLIPIPFSIILSDFLQKLFVLVSIILIYKNDDKKGSCCLCFKPWIYQEVQVIYIGTKIQGVQNQGGVQYPGVEAPPVYAQTPSTPLSYPTLPYPYPGYSLPNQPIAKMA